MKALKLLVRPNILHWVSSSPEAAYHAGFRVRLDRCESPFNAPFNRYPEEEEWQISERLSKIIGVKQECIVMTRGAYDALELLVRTFCIPQRDNILAAAPTCFPIERIARIADIECRYFLLQSRFAFSQSCLHGTMNDHSKILFLQSPGDPSGILLDREEIFAATRTMPGIVAIDESYIEYTRKPSLLASKEIPEGLVIIRSFSKSFAAAGLRLGYIVAAPAICRYLRAAQQPYPISSPAFNEAIDLLEHRFEADKWVNRVIEERNKVMVACSTLPFCKEVFPSEANFFIIRVNNVKKVLEHLHADGISVTDISHLPHLENCLRITIGLPGDNCALLSSLRKL